jgi:hypothetical protein
MGKSSLLLSIIAYPSRALLCPLLQVLSPRHGRHFVQSLTDQRHGFLSPLKNDDFDSEALRQGIPVCRSMVLPQDTAYHKCFSNEYLRLL